MTIGVDLNIDWFKQSDGFIPHQDDWGKLGQFIGRNTHLTELKFCQLSSTGVNPETGEYYDDDEPLSDLPHVEHFKDFCIGLANNISVKKVDFHDTPMILGEGRPGGETDGYGLAYILMSDWLEKNIVEEMKMPFCHCQEGNYDNSGENRKLSTVLAKFSSLKVFMIEFDDEYDGDEESPCEVSEQIINALSNHSDLEYVQISHGSNTKWIRRGYDALTRFISDSKVKKLGLSGGMNDEGAIAVAAALDGNTTLNEIVINYYALEITGTGWKAFTKLLSDSGSIMDTYNSNHTLQKLFTSNYHGTVRVEAEVWQREKLGDALYSLLKVNALCNIKSDAARVKIIMRHLSGDFSMEPFTEMDLAALPTALAWMGRTNADIASLYKHADADLGLMYKFVRGIAPVIFDSSPVTGKRKAQQS